MNPFDFLPRRVNVLFPEIKMGNAVAHQTINVRMAIEYVRTGLYREQYVEGEFVGLIYSPQTAKPVRPLYIPEEMPPIEVLGVKFVQPAGASPTWARTVSMSVNA